MDLEIFVVTYNRQNKLRATLDYLANSKIKDLSITVLNNKSTDDSLEVANSFKNKLSNLNVVTNKVNVGANANILKAFELSNSTYTWVLCDDDVINLSNFDDVLKVAHEGDVNLIHVGAHAQKEWLFGGKYSTPKELLAVGYPYFKFSSFIPCNIFKTESFTNNFMIQAYNNIVNAYPHMPFLLSVFKNDEKMYVSESQIMTAGMEGQSYTVTEWFFWWMKTCELLINPKEVRIAFLDQWKDIGMSNEEFGLQSFMHAKSLFDDKEFILRFEKKYMTPNDISIIKKYEKQLKGEFKFKVFLYESLVKAKIITPKNSTQS